MSGSPVWCYPHWGWVAGDHPASHLTPLHTATCTHKHTHGHMCNTSCLLEDVWLTLTHTHPTLTSRVTPYKPYYCHTHYPCVFFFLTHTVLTCSLSLTHTASPSLLLCEKPQPLNEPQICPVNWCSHTHIQTPTLKNTQVQIHTYTQML